MAKTPKQHGQPWTNVQEIKLKELIKGNTPTPLIAYKLERTEDAIKGKVRDLGLSLKPTNKSPYNRQK